MNGESHVISFTQNTREEVRVLGEAGNVAGCIPAETGSHQQTYLCIRKKGGTGHMKARTENNRIASQEFYRAASYGMFEPSETSGTLDCEHCSGIGNGTPCLIVKRKGA